LFVEVLFDNGIVILVIILDAEFVLLDEFDAEFVLFEAGLYKVDNDIEFKILTDAETVKF